MTIEKKKLQAFYQRKNVSRQKIWHRLHEQVKDRLDNIEKVVIKTQEAGIRIIDKTGP